jgi:hypothetical protein
VTVIPGVVAVTVYSAAEELAVGVPVIAPLVALMISPAGRGGDTEKDMVGSPNPRMAGVLGVIGTPTV